jgi:hypothetical protein
VRKLSRTMGVNKVYREDEMPVKNLKASGGGRFCVARKKLVLPDK